MNCEIMVCSCECGITHSTDVYRLYNIPLCEEKRLFSEEYSLQSDTEGYWKYYKASHLTFENLFKVVAEKYSISMDIVNEWIENIMFLYSGIKKARDFQDVYDTIYAVTRFITKTSFGKQIGRLMENLTAAFEVQSFETGIFQKILSTYASVKNSPLVDKVRQLVVLGLASSVFAACGIDTALEKFQTIYGEGLKRFFSTTDFLAHALELAVYVIERTVQCFRTGSLSPFYHSSQTYGKWAEEAYLLI
jgi:hypothetical protein